jgi:hypothetical protein
MRYLRGNLSIRGSFFSGRLDGSPRQKTSLQGVERGSVKISLHALHALHAILSLQREEKGS